MILPTDTNGQWTQDNTSDKFGSLFYTENVNFDEAGYLKLSPRSIVIAQQSDNTNFGIPHAIGLWNTGDYEVATTSNANFDVDISAGTLSATENSGSNEPTMTTNSHAVWWQGLWFASTATAILSRPATGGATENWTSRITGLTSGVRHYMSVFASRKQLAVTNGNVIKQYDTSYANTVDLTLPSDFEAIGLAFNNGQMGIVTRLGSTTQAQDAEARFYVWNGATTGYNGDAGVGSTACVAVCAYKSSFAVLTKNGRLLYWNGGALTELANFPFFHKDNEWGDVIADLTFGDCMRADGNVIYLNVGFQLNSYGRKRETMVENCPSGVWCYDPNVGLYHRWSPSISKASVFAVTDANFNTTTNILTVSSGTVPQTGSLARLTNSNTGIDPLVEGQDYYVIKLSSTTFKLATTREKAFLSDAIDLISSGTGDATRFWMYDIIDYGNTYHGQTGAVTKTNATSLFYQDIIFGGDYQTSALANNDSLCLVAPLLEARGFAVTPKYYPRNTKDNVVKAYIRFRPLGQNDKIVIKHRGIDVYGLPILPTNTGNCAIWTGTKEFYTTQDVSEAKTYLDNNGELEIKFVAGVGAGQAVKITSITENDGTYAVVLDEEVIGAASTLKSEFVINNWKVIGTITSDHNAQGFAEFSVGESCKWHQFKIELRGYNTTIEDFRPIYVTQEK